MLTKIDISNFKSIGSCILPFQQENVIVGQNGVGKSNILDAIHFVRDIANDGIDHAITKRHGINSIRRWSKTRPYNITIKMDFEQGEEYGFYKIVIASSGGGYSVLEEEGSWCGVSPFRLAREENSIVTSFKRGEDRSKKGDSRVRFDIPDERFSGIPPIEISDSEAVLTQFGSQAVFTQSYFFRRLHSSIVSCGAYSIYPNKIREPQTISKSDVLADDGTNLASIIRQMRSTSQRTNKESLTSALRQVLPIINEIKIDTAGGFYVPVFRVRETEGGQSHELNMAQISDGTLRMLGMLTAFYQPRAPARITMEEPEQMIHPGLLPILVEASRDYLEANQTPKRQVFFTTHSPNLLDMFNPESIIGVQFEEGVSKPSNISARQLKIIKDKLFTAGELLVTEGIFS